MGFLDKAKDLVGDKAKDLGTDATKQAVQSVLDEAIGTVNSEIDGLSGPSDEEKEHMKKGVELLSSRVTEGINQKLGA